MTRVCERLLFLSKPAYCCFSVILFQMIHARVPSERLESEQNRIAYKSIEILELESDMIIKNYKSKSKDE